MIPGFFLISGLLQQGKDMFDRKSLTRTIRDNIINNYAYTAIVVAATGLAPCEHLPELSLWFLTALALYRFLLFPIVKCFTQSFGRLPGGVVSVAMLLGLQFFLKHNVIEGPQDEIMGKLLLVRFKKFEEIIILSPFYVLGLLVDRSSMRQVLANPYILACAIPCVFLSNAIGLELTKLVAGILPHDHHALHDIVNMTIKLSQQALGSLSFIACAAPLADAQNPYVKTLARLVASCGSRTLYGYYLHMLLRVTPSWYQLSSIGSGSSAGLLLQILGLAALCSPFAERCFGWLVSPQWLFDAASVTGKEAMK
jgi:hypothetical protein